ncbi:MAG: AraC family transcriptional regulator [Victivallaceae bacterium]|nr:AraC family transcriptional regulator [Victivallaceae bacterium]
MYYWDGATKYYTEPEEKTVHMIYEYFRDYSGEPLTCPLLVRGIFLPEHYDKRLKQNFFNLEIILSGTMYVRSGKILALAEPGDVVVMLPHEDHEFRPAGETVEKIGIILEGKLLDRLLEGIGISQSGVFSLSESDRLTRAVEDLREEMSVVAQNMVNADRLSAASFRILMVLESVMQRSAGHSLFEEMAGFIDQNIREYDLLNVLARHFHLSAYKIRKLFLAEQNLQPGKYIMKIRMQQAHKLLLKGHLPIKEVAAQCGYLNAMNFSTAFRRYYHVSPSCHRQRQD